jgi:hypothetical protein
MTNRIGTAAAYTSDGEGGQKPSIPKIRLAGERLDPRNGVIRAKGLNEHDAHVGVQDHGELGVQARAGRAS